MKIKYGGRIMYKASRASFQNLLKTDSQETVNALHSHADRTESTAK